MMNISKDVKDLLQPQLDTAVKEEVCLLEDLADNENYCDRDTNIIERDSKIPCEHCGTLWNSKNDLTVHIRSTHQLKDNCSICGKTFKKTLWKAT